MPQMEVSDDFCSIWNSNHFQSPSIMVLDVRSGPAVKSFQHCTEAHTKNSVFIECSAKRPGKESPPSISRSKHRVRVWTCSCDVSIVIERCSWLLPRRQHPRCSQIDLVIASLSLLPSAQWRCLIARPIWLLFSIREHSCCRWLYCLLYTSDAADE